MALFIKVMYYVYILKSVKDNLFYIGSSADLKKRLKEHQMGQSLSTKGRRPFILLFYEAFLDKRDALRREKYFKQSKGKSSLRMTLRESLL